MFEFIKNIFKKKPNKSQSTEDLSKKQPSVIYKNQVRFLKLKNDECALVLHEKDQCEVVFTKYEGQDAKQDFTANEELLMALAIFLKQPGFGEMLISEFHKAAMKNKNLFADQETNKETDTNNTKNGV